MSSSLRRSTTFFAIAALSGLLASGCTAARFHAGPGGSVAFEDDLPPPEGDQYLANGLSISIFSDSIGDDAFKARLGERLRASAGKDFASINGTGKKPVYSIDISEVGYTDSSDPSSMGAVGGAIVGAGVGYGAGGRTGGTIGAVGGGLFGYFALAKDKHLWAFQVDIKQKTSVEGQRQIQSESETGAGGATSFADEDFGTVTSAEDVTKQSSSARFNTTSNTLQMRRTFFVKVDGPLFMLGQEEAARLAAEKVMDQLGSYLFRQNIF